MLRILLVTGEASGDLHGANLARELRNLESDVELVGVGGDKMLEAGVRMLPGIGRLDVMGVPGLGQLLTAMRNYLAITRFLRETSCDAAVFIDHPGLNLRLARVAKKIGHRVVYYIAPQVWAWRPGRLHLIARIVDRMIVILPFEEPLFRQAGVRCDFVGHPLLDAMAPSYDRIELRKRYGLDDAGVVLGLLPGSREREVRSLLPAMLHTAARLTRLYPALQPVVAQAASIRDEMLEEVAAESRVKPRVIKDQPNEVMAASDLLLVASGTATLQGAVIGTPMVIVYRASWLTYWLARWLITIKHIGLVNIVAGRSIVPEVIQQDVTPERLTEEAAHLLRDRVAARQMREAFRAVRQSLGSPGASKRAAALVLAECRT
jgi:lipid-A-disaccharide synthase